MFGAGRAGEIHVRSVSQIVFRFAVELGIMPLTGTTDADPMQADLEIFNFRLTPEEVGRIEKLATA
jgi:diketogulonate reductase-like aldo/keto reductase